jgi:hypothetical protein
VTRFNYVRQRKSARCEDSIDSKLPGSQKRTLRQFAANFTAKLPIIFLTPTSLETIVSFVYSSVGSGKLTQKLRDSG